ncbi:MAG: PilZ domain-containing protein [Pseudomonadota bacterium]
MGLFGIRIIGKKKRALELPSQAVLRQACLRPGRQVELVIVTDAWGNECDVRLSRLHDLDGKNRLLLAQTLPRLNSYMVGQILEITFLIRLEDVPGGRRVRVGYKTPLVAVWDNYRVRPELRGDVLVVDGPQTLGRFTLRRHYRLPSDRLDSMEIYLLPQRAKVQILDISLGGVRFSHPRTSRLSVGSIIDLLLVYGSLSIPLEGVVVRNGTLGGRHESMPFTAVRFSRPSAQYERQLTSLINDLQRGN